MTADHVLINISVGVFHSIKNPVAIVYSPTGIDMTSNKNLYAEEKNGKSDFSENTGNYSSSLHLFDPMQTIIVDSEGRITSVTDEKNIYPEGLPDKGAVLFRDFDSEYDIDMYKEMMNCIKSRKNFSYISNKDDKIIHSIKIAPLDSGAVINIEDISERILKSRNLIENDARFKALFDHKLLLLFLHDLQGNFLDANEAALNLLGYTKDELPGMHISAILCDEYLLVALNALEEVRKTGKSRMPIEFKLKRRDGEYLWVICETNLIEKEGKPYAIQGVARDITQRKLAETSLNESEEKYRTIFENINTGICRNTGGPQGRFIHANPALARMLGYNTVDELYELQVSEIYKNPGDRIKFVDRVSEAGTVKGKELKLKRKDGTCIVASCTAKACYNEENDIKWIDILVDDITKQKRAEEKLLQSYKNLRKTLTSTVQAMAMAIESRDPYTAGHQRRVAELAYLIASEMHFSQDKIDGIRLAGLIHDLGKITIPAEILSKPCELTGIEFELIKNHCRIGYDILKSIDFPWPVAQIVYQHHERLDGSGYPLALSNDDILMEAKILAVSDVVEAMATNRPYRATLGIERALEEIKTNSGILYEPCVVEACVTLFTKKGFKFNGV